MTRDGLIGIWRCNNSGNTFDLRPDGSCVIRGTTPDGDAYEERSEWEYGDAEHFQLRLVIPPDPEMPGLEDGAVDVTEYEITSERSDQMTLVTFDVDLPEEWIKAV